LADMADIALHTSLKRERRNASFAHASGSDSERNSIVNPSNERENGSSSLKAERTVTVTCRCRQKVISDPIATGAVERFKETGQVLAPVARPAAVVESGLVAAFPLAKMG
jgi:hypothetical protein